MLKNSLIGENGGRAKKLDVHNRSVFNDLAHGNVSTYPEKTWLRVFQQNRHVAEIQFPTLRRTPSQKNNAPIGRSLPAPEVSNYPAFNQ